MKTLQIFALILAATAVAPTAPGQTAAPDQAKAILISEAESKDVWIELAKANQFRYRDTETAIDRKLGNMSDYVSIYFYEPKEFKAARDLYQARRFDEAKAEFAKIATAYKEIRSMPGNYGTLAGYYELECLRQLGDLDGLATALEGFRKDGLTREHHLRQLELYNLWSAVRSKSWDRLRMMCEDRLMERLPGYQRAQIAYCHGLALEALEKPDEALNAYATAITADYGGSEGIVRESVFNSLRIYQADESVLKAIKLWGTEDEEPNSAGRLRLEEAASLAASYERALSNGKALPAECKELLKYKVKPGVSTKPAPKKPAPKKETPQKAAAEAAAKKADAKKDDAKKDDAKKDDAKKDDAKKEDPKAKKDGKK